jgi:hypothetical protein
VQYLSLDYRLAGQSVISYHIKGEKKSFFIPLIMPGAFYPRSSYYCIEFGSERIPRSLLRRASIKMSDSVFRRESESEH